MNTYPIIGLAGTFASGKDTLAHYLVKECDYLHVSTSDMVRAEALKAEGSIERPVLHAVANRLRQEKGAGIFAEMAISLFRAKQGERDDYRGLVISGLRSLGEAKAIVAAGGKIVFVDAPIKIRYERMVGRKRDNEVRLSLEEFVAQEAKELEVGETPSDADFNLLGIKSMSDAVIMNDSTLDIFLANCRSALHL